MTVKDWIKQEQGKHLCHCGCGGEITILKCHHNPSHGIPKYIHGHQNTGKKFSDTHKLNMSNVRKGTKHSDEHKHKISTSLKNMSDEKKHNRSQKISESKKGKMFSDEHKLNMSKSMKGRQFSEEHRRKLSESNTGKTLSDESKTKVSNATKGENNPMFGRNHTEESKRKISESRKGKYIGENNPAWKGGLSFEPYCRKFNNELKERVRNEFNRKCVMCGAEENGRKLSIHHIDYSKTQGCKGETWKLVPLCQSCHMKTNHRREYWELHLTNILASHKN